MNKKQPETTYNKQDTTYNDLNLPTVSQKKTQNNRQQADFQIILQHGANYSLLWCFPPNIWLQSFEHCLASNISIVSCVLFMGYNIYFFLSGFCVKNINKSQDTRERERVFFLLVSTTSTWFANCLIFSIYSYQRGLMMIEDITSRSRNCITFFHIKTSIRLNKGAGFLDLLLNISFQPLIVTVRHSLN